jgi:transcriptional regulator with XRE-family HTH domain
MEKILKNIKEIRLNLSYNQEFMADKLGIEQVSYGLIENGKRKLKYETLERIALIFKMDIIDVITYPDVYKKFDNNNIAKTPRVTLQIDIEEDIKADVIKLAFGDRVLEIKNI